ncbi:ABC transporter permease [Nocardia stercoris]|uniref:ABC transporter permease n=1 Tax=Nocardia stercoris TaxID=2483361 RepID=A0A3M2L500_9NOCA|nr:ABC transporter permease [Nocardia stercoris]RMI32739.1 ABC transporter permease [Nocardia stercoris]
MFLARRELWFARSRFGLMGGVVALIAVLIVMLCGLSSGLVQDGVSGLKAMPVDAFAFAAGTKTESAFTRSTVELRQVDSWRARPDVAEAEPFGNTLVNAHTDHGTPVDLALFGVRPGSFLAPQPADGTALDAPDGIVVSSTAAGHGIRLGDTVTVDRLGTTLRVVGITGDQRTFGHVDVAYVPLPRWQEIHAGLAPGERAEPEIYQQASAIALRGRGGIDLGAGDLAADTSTMTREASFAASPGYSAEMSTMSLIKVFLYAISALVVGAFFMVWTVQRGHELAVLRAMGIPTGYLLRDAVAQAAAILVGATALGVAAAVGGAHFISGMPFALEPAAVATGAVLLVVMGLLGAVLTTLGITRVDPLTALGAHR